MKLESPICMVSLVLIFLINHVSYAFLFVLQQKTHPRRLSSQLNLEKKIVKHSVSYFVLLV